MEKLRLSHLDSFALVGMSYKFDITICECDSRLEYSTNYAPDAHSNQINIALPK